MSDIPGWEGSVGPFPHQYGKPHVYARDVQSGAGNCVCGATLEDKRHVQVVPGVPNPSDVRASERAQIVAMIRHYFAAAEDPLYEDVRILCGRIERGEHLSGNPV